MSRGSRWSRALPEPPSSRRRWTTAVVAIGLLGVGAVLGVALRTVLAPPPGPPAAPAYALVAAGHGTVERSIRLDVTAARTGGAAVVNATEGVLTERLVPQGDRVTSGDRLYSVDLAPAFIASGAVPAFRDLQRGLEGADVRQLQEMLVQVGVRSEPPDGIFGPATQQQVDEWHRQEGLPATGSVPLGQVAFVAGLPGTANWADDAPPGARLTPGTVVAEVAPDEVQFTMTVPEDQLHLLEPGMAVEITVGDVLAEGLIGAISQESSDVGGAANVARIDPVDGEGSICEDRCGGIAADGDQILPARVIVTPPTTGTTVPAAAVVVGTDGNTEVTLADGTAITVTVEAATGGEAVVSGLDPGADVRVPVGDA